MHDRDVTLERPTDAGTQLAACLTEVPVRLRLLGHDRCEFEPARRFAEGEQISIRLYRMGSIRPRVTTEDEDRRSRIPKRLPRGMAQPSASGRISSTNVG